LKSNGKHSQKLRNYQEKIRCYELRVFIKNKISNWGKKRKQKIKIIRKNSSSRYWARQIGVYEERWGKEKGLGLQIKSRKANVLRF